MRILFALLVVAALAGCSTSHTDAGHPDLVAMRKDPELAAAVKQAQAELPKFLDRLQHLKQGEHFAVQARFGKDLSFEHMWVDHLSFDGKNLQGTLADQPSVVTSLHKGDAVSFPITDVMDWLILSGGKREGGYAEAVLRKKGH